MKSIVQVVYTWLNWWSRLYRFYTIDYTEEVDCIDLYTLYQTDEIDCTGLSTLDQTDKVDSTDWYALD